MSATAVLFSGRRFGVERRVRRARDGTPHVYEVVRHPGSAVILPRLDEQRVVLVANERPAVERELLELPAGTLEPGEEPLACAVRELEEETGYRAGCTRRLLSLYPSPGICSERMDVFLAEQLTPGVARPEADERLRVVTLTRAEALAAIRDGRIVDGKTIAALLYFERFGTAGAE